MTESQKPEPTIKWPDLSAYGMRMVSCKLPTGDWRIFMIGGDKQASRVKSLGFKSNGGMWIRPDSRVDMGALMKAFPRAQIKEMTRGEVVRYMRLKSQDQEDVKAKIEMNQATPLGMNHLGQLVLKGVDGRFIRAQTGSVTRESDTSAAVFLRALSSEDLELCADGLIGELIGGRNITNEDIARFVNTVYDEKVELGDPRVSAVHTAITNALARKMFSDVTDSGRDAFNTALRLHESLPPLDSSLAEKITPMPIGVVAQRLLGQTDGKTVYTPSIENGAFVSTISNGNILVDSLIGQQTSDISRLRIGVGLSARDEGAEAKHDLFVGGFPFEQLDEPYNLSGTRVNRGDHLAVMKALLDRSSDGRSVFVLKAGTKYGEIDTETKRLLTWISARYQIDGIVEMDGSLFGKGGSNNNRYILRVSKKAPGNFDVDAKIEVAYDYETLWNASDRFVSDEERAAEKKPHLENSYQSPYSPTSKVSESSTMIPRNLVGATRYALARVEEEYGDIDEFVSKELQIPVSDLGEYLSAEQVDAVALAIGAHYRGRAFIEADQTGLGKGRVLAAMARWAVLKGQKVLFVTERPTLFSDFFRDIRDTGSMSVMKPLIMNDGVSIVLDGAKVIPATRKEKLLEVIEGGDVPDDFNLVMATYSQFNRESKPADPIAKTEWFVKNAEGAFLILDESHNAAGESNTGENIDRVLNVADGVIYSSATFAKDAANFRLYRRVMPASVSANTVPEILKAGGDPLAEVFSSMLAQDGVMIRREHDLSDLSIETVVDVENLERNEMLSDKLAQILEAMGVLSGEVTKFVNEKNKLAQSKVVQNVAANATKKKKPDIGFFTVNFGSRLYAVMRQFMMAAKTDTAAAIGIKALEEGQKPVFVIENTNEAIIRSAVNQMEEYEAMDDDEDDDLGIDAELADMMASDLDVDETVMQVPVTFKNILYKILDKLVVVNETKNGKITSQERLEMDDVKRFQESISMMIDAFPDIYISPIDILRSKIEEAGFTCGELSGRKMGIVERPDGTQAVVKISDTGNKTKIIYSFNEGYMDAVVLTTAGSTGISLHSSEKFADTRQRKMIELQIPNNVATRVQFFGRVNRKGQVCPPKIVTIASGLPSEMRLLSMQNSKLREMSANTTSNRDNSILASDFPDILNKVGSQICRKYLEDNLNITNRLSIPTYKVTEEYAKHISDPIWYANQLTGRLGMMSVEDQRNIYEDITRTYKSEIADMEMKGVNPFKTSELDIKATIVDRKPVFQSAWNSGSVFDESVYLTTLRYEQEVDTCNWAGIEKRIEASEHEMNGDPKAVMSKYVGFMENYRDRLLNNSLSKDFPDVATALAMAGDNPTKALNARMDYIAAHVPNLLPGVEITFSDLFGTRTGVIVKAHPPTPVREHLLGEYMYTIALPGDRPIEISLYALHKDTAFSWNPRPSIATVEGFNSVTSGKVIRQQRVLDGNMFQAARWALDNKKGTSVVYTTDDGTRHRGVMLPATMSGLAIEIPFPVDRNVAEEFVRTESPTGHNYYYASPTKSLKNDVIVIMSRGELKLSIPKGRAAERLVTNSNIPELQNVSRDKRNAINSQHIKIEPANIPTFWNEFYAAGFSIFLDNKTRSRVEEIQMLQGIAASNKRSIGI